MKTQIFQMIAMATMLLIRTGSANACQADDALSKPSVESTPAPQQVETERQYRGGSIIIRWSDTKDELSGFSNKTGRWQKLKIQPMEKIEPNAVEFVGAVRIKEGIAAYSGETGTWDVVHLPETSTAKPSVSPDVVQFKEGDHFYAFAAATGRWTSPTDPALKPITGAYQSPKQISQAELYAKLLEWLQTVPATEFQGTVQYLDGVVMLLPRTKEWQTKATAVVVGLDSSPRDFPDPAAVFFEPGINSGPPSAEHESETIKIEWSKTRNEFFGFSKTLEKGEALPIGTQRNAAQLVGTKVAMVSFMDLGQHQFVAGFSSNTGTWDVVDLGDWGDKPPIGIPALQSLKLNDAQTSFRNNGHKYFLGDTGRWSSPTDPELQEQNRTLKLRYDRTSAPTVFVDVNNRMKKFETWRDSLPAYKRRGILLSVTSGASTGTATLSASRLSWMTELDAKVRELFDVTDPGEENGTSSDGTPDAAGVPALEPRIEGLRAELTTLEQAVRKSSQNSSSFRSETDQPHELHKLVEQSFDLRQQLQELEAQRLRLKLQQVENNLAVRAKSRDAMVTRRMEELRRPDIGAKAPQQKLENPSTSRSSSPGSESIAPSIADVRIENANSTIQWPQPGEIARQLRGFRESAIRDMEDIRDPERSVETWSQPLEKLIADGLLQPGTGEDARQDRLVRTEERAARLQKHLNDVRRDWNYAWSAYQSQLELFRLDLNDRKKEESLAALEVKQQTDANRESPNAYSPGEIRVSEIKLERSRIAVQRAEQTLKLYADIEANVPELNPATLKGLDEIAASKEVTASVPSEPGQNLPQQVISMAEQLRKLRAAAEKLRKERQPHENLITQYSRPLDQLKAEGVVSAETTEEELKTQIARSKPEFDRLTRELDTATKAWKQAWSAYQSQSRLLELEVTHAKKSLVSAEQTLGETHAKMNQGLVGSQEVRETEARREAAVVQHEKSRELLHLWHELESNEPELNPDWKPESSGKNVPD